MQYRESTAHDCNNNALGHILLPSWEEKSCNQLGIVEEELAYAFASLAVSLAMILLVSIFAELEDSDPLSWALKSVLAMDEPFLFSRGQ
jgi:hypothetical protein